MFNWELDLHFLNVKFDLIVDIAIFSWLEFDGCVREQVIALLVQFRF